MSKGWYIGIFGLAVLSFGAGLYLFFNRSEPDFAEVQGASDVRDVQTLTVQVRSRGDLRPLPGVILLASEIGAPSGRSPFAQTISTDDSGVAIFSLPQARYLVQPTERQSYVGNSTIELRGNAALELRLIKRQPELAQPEESSQ